MSPVGSLIFATSVLAVHFAAAGAARPATRGLRLSAVLHPYQFTQVHMGLPVRLVLYAPDRTFAEDTARAAFSRIAELDQVMSDYRPDSELRKLERHAGEPVRVSPDLMSVLSRAVAIAAATGGAFDPSAGPLVALWRQSRKSGRLPDRSSLMTARALVGWRRIELDPARSTVRLTRPGMRLDLGAIAKGYILQEALRAMRALEVTRALVESGGDIVAGDPPPGREGWHVEVEGADTAFARRAAHLTNAALASSGPSSQFVEINGVRYSHIVDPRTGLGVTSTRVARVIAEDAATADALATALTVLGERGAKQVSKNFPEVMMSMVER
jgi:thiamine biosynthesis lipoprotein